MPRNLAAVSMVTLLLAAAACGNEPAAPESSSGEPATPEASSGPAQLTVTRKSVLPASGNVFIEGAVDYVRIRGAGVDRTLRFAPHEPATRRLTVPAGSYRVTGYSRGCVGACLHTDDGVVYVFPQDPPRRFCRATVALEADRSLTMMRNGADGCEIRFYPSISS